eukprot:764091-Hanusia_phi.AAC.25
MTSLQGRSQSLENEEQHLDSRNLLAGFEISIGQTVAACFLTSSSLEQSKFKAGLNALQSELQDNVMYTIHL